VVRAVQVVKVVNEGATVQGPATYLDTVDDLDTLDNLLPRIDFGRECHYVQAQWTIARIGRGVEEMTGPRSREAPFAFPAR
jgi:hypothetical protein